MPGEHRRGLAVMVRKQGNLNKATKGYRKGYKDGFGVGRETVRCRSALPFQITNAAHNYWVRDVVSSLTSAKSYFNRQSYPVRTRAKLPSVSGDSQ